MTDRNTSQSIYTSQSIRKRIYTYNTWMILLAAAICVVVCGGCLGIYWEHQERVLEASARAELGDAAEEFIKSITVRSQGFYVTALLAVMFCIVAMTIVSRIYAEILVSRYEEAREELVAGVSHELRTPMTVIQGAIRSILDGVGSARMRPGSRQRAAVAWVRPWTAVVSPVAMRAWVLTPHRARL